MRAMILAAGYGTRLWPLTIDRAKPAIPFMGRPLVGYVAEYLAQFGCREIGVNLHHRPESVRAALGDGSAFGVRLEYFNEPTILGTSGALDNARAFLTQDTFVVVNGKIATNIDLHAALATHRQTGALATLVLRPNGAHERYSIVHVRAGLIAGFGGFPVPASDNAGDAASVPPTVECAGQRSSQAAEQQVVENSSVAAPLMFTGIHIIEPRLFDYIPPGRFSDTVTDVYLPAIAAGERIAAHVAAGYWYELSTVGRYLDTSIALLRREQRDVALGPGATIATGAHVHDAVLWEQARVEAGAHVRRAVLGAGVCVSSGESLTDVAVVRAELVRGVERPAKGLAGTFRGDNFVAPLAQ